MCVCVYVCMYVCMYACMFLCMYACIHACMHCTYVCMYGRVSSRLYPVRLRCEPVCGQVAESDGVVYVTERGILQGFVTLNTLMSREI